MPIIDDDASRLGAAFGGEPEIMSVHAARDGYRRHGEDDPSEETQADLSHHWTTILLVGGGAKFGVGMR
ncbi:MAG: hypothetical protein QOJ58_525 [Alphaproteobacteria bacterium]|jgi:hypothetical protein|nr:hypothetical protein [Alphaproteobacteria bacterium]